MRRFAWLALLLLACSEYRPECNENYRSTVGIRCEGNAETDVLDEESMPRLCEAVYRQRCENGRLGPWRTPAGHLVDTATLDEILRRDPLGPVRDEVEPADEVGGRDDDRAEEESEQRLEP